MVNKLDCCFSIIKQQHLLQLYNNKKNQNINTINLPFLEGREFLCLNVSSLSRELNGLKMETIHTQKKNRFHLKTAKFEKKF